MHAFGKADARHQIVFRSHTIILIQLSHRSVLTNTQAYRPITSLSVLLFTSPARQTAAASRLVAIYGVFLTSPTLRGDSSGGSMTQTTLLTCHVMTTRVRCRKEANYSRTRKTECLKEFVKETHPKHYRLTKRNKAQLNYSAGIYHDRI